jgi:hypothetical protein
LHVQPQHHVGVLFQRRPDLAVPSKQTLGY